MPIVKLFLLSACSIALSATCAAAVFNRTDEETFGRLKDGTPVKIFTLRNENGMSARIMEHGAIVTELLAQFMCLTPLFLIPECALQGLTCRD